MASLFPNDVDVVGIESSRDELISWLVDGSSHCTIYTFDGGNGGTRQGHSCQESLRSPDD